MDSYGTKFQLLSSASDFRSRSGDGCHWDERDKLFRLNTHQSSLFSDVSFSTAISQWQVTPPLLQDRQGQLGFLSDDKTRLLYAPAWPYDAGEQVVASSIGTQAESLEQLALAAVTAPEGSEFLDLHLGGDGRVALPYSNGSDSHGLLMVHLGKRWQQRCPLLEQPKRVWVDYLNRTWLAADGWLALCSGEPLPQAYQPEPLRFEPLPINPQPLTRHWRQPLPVGYELLAMSADRERLYLLLFHSVDKQQKLWVRSLQDDVEQPFSEFSLPMLPFVIDIAAMGGGLVALMLPKGEGASAPRLDLPVIEVPTDDSATSQINLIPRRYPQHSQRRARFITGQAETACYLSESGPKVLHPLPQARFISEGSATLQQRLDSGEQDTCWHRLYLEGCIPPGCTLQIEALAFDEFGNAGSDWQRQPPSHWQEIASEIPFYLGRFTPKQKTQGLFEILLQRESGAVRELRGRYLALRIIMQGDGRHSPAIAAIRVYHARFSWQQAYLPAHFHQQQRADSTPGVANGADVRERFLAGLEGMMTPLEERIVASECWLYPDAAPADHLPSLARMVGSELPEHWPLARKRHWLQALATLRENRGTFAGLCLALDIATDGAVTRGQVVPLENYRLRRTMATILGIDMSDDDHPLTLGTGQSGNSIVGESLILTEDESQLFLALIAPELATRKGETGVMSDFFDHYAHKISVIIHHGARDYREGVQETLAQWVPAHLQWRLIETDHPFVLGLSPLLGIDTYLEQAPAWRAVVLDDTYIGREGVLKNPAAFSPTEVMPLGDRA